MKKILILTAVSALFVSCSSTGSFKAIPSPIIEASSSSSNSASGTIKFNSLSIASKYNRENTVSTADMQKLVN